MIDQRSLKLVRSHLARVAGDREGYASASLYEGALLGVLAATELLVTGDPTSTLWHKMWRYECAVLRLATLSGVALSDREPELPHLVLAALDPILHEAVPTTQSAEAQKLASYLNRFRIPHADLPPEHVEGFCVEFVTVYQRLRGMEPEYSTAWRLWHTLLADARRPGRTITQSISGRLDTPESIPDINARIHIALVRISRTLESVWVHL